MGLFLGVVTVLAVVAVGAAVAARRIGHQLARRVVLPRSRAATRIHAATETSVTLDADRRTLHRGQFGLWFGSHGHAVVGHARAHDRSAGTVTRELLHVSGDLAAADAGYWTGNLHPDPASLRRHHTEVLIDVPGGRAPAWRIRPERPSAASTWAIHIHGWSTTRVTALRSVPAADALGMTSLVVSYRGDGEGPAVPGGISTLGMREWEDVDAAVGYALAHGAQRVVLVGWSLGGAIALQLTERSAHRAAIDRLVLIGPVTDWRAVIRNGASERCLPAWTAELAIRALARPEASARLGLPEPIDFDRLDWARPGRLTVPALVIHSDGDREVPLSSSVLFAMANPRMVRLVELSPADHCWEYNVDPAAFNRAVIEFLDPDRHVHRSARLA
ncbi:alpha/beta hydrolase family protein [Leifsonia sp. LS-T14]|uniref:alpha/beta hydrolase family protein n=1 Tax=unclassified Leifsonia TaxID=2663824 RepID=UPI0035A6D2B3